MASDEDAALFTSDSSSGQAVNYTVLKRVRRLLVTVPFDAKPGDILDVGLIDTSRGRVVLVQPKTGPKVRVGRK